LAGQPATLDMNGCNLYLNSWTNELHVLPGGVVKNANYIQIGNNRADDPDARYGGGTGNCVILEGGEIGCEILDAFKGNMLAPVVGSNGIKPLVATNHARFEEGSKIAPVHPDKKITGHFPILTAPEIFAPPLDDPGFFEPPANGMYWSLKMTEDQDGQTLWLFCLQPPTLFLVR